VSPVNTSANNCREKDLHSMFTLVYIQELHKSAPFENSPN